MKSIRKKDIRIYLGLNWLSVIFLILGFVRNEFLGMALGTLIWANIFARRHCKCPYCGSRAMITQLSFKGQGKHCPDCGEYVEFEEENRK